MIVTKPQHPIATSAAATAPAGTTEASPTKNSVPTTPAAAGGTPGTAAAAPSPLIVFDLSQEQFAAATGKNNVLSDILTATGIMPEDSVAAVTDGGDEASKSKEEVEGNSEKEGKC